jgi:predicted CXXCH cytochrome family protein
MKYKATIGLAAVLSMLFLLPEFASDKVSSSFTHEKNMESEGSAESADTPAAGEVSHSDYSSKEQCLECHPRAFPSHIFSRPLTMYEDLPLDLEGNITCFTCHNCTTGECVFRISKRELCSICHDCSQGMSCALGAAHMGSSENIENVINACPACHDGATGPYISPDGHMINKYYRIDEGFRDISHTKVILVNGKVTCISCHNPYKNEENRLVKSNEGSRLCLTCHRK